MATLKPTVKSKLKTGMYIVYIRVVHNRQSSFIRTSWMVNDKGIKGKDVIDPYVIQQTSNLISRYYSALNQINTSNWTASEVVAYLTTSAEDMSFSDYARKHIEKLIKRGQERTSRNYKWALSFLPHHMEAFDGAIERSLERTAVVRITLTEPPTGKRKQYDKNGDEMKNEREQSQACLGSAE